jgi:hypothetical protein
MGEYIEYQVNAGDCVKSIAHEYGRYWETVWNDGKNADLKKRRKNPNILMAGDVLWIPPLREEEASCASGARHKFRFKGAPAKIEFVIKKDNEPVKNMPYTAIIDGQSSTGNTDGNGKVTLKIMPEACSGELRVGNPPKETVYPVRLGALDPVEELSGVRHRLTNLGYFTGEDAEGEMGEGTVLALKRFQRDNGMAPTGKLDDATREKLKQIHGC